MNDPFNTAITWLDEPLLGAAEGPLTGRTLLVKDLIDTAGIRTTYGSRIYGDHVPAAHATVCTTGGRSTRQRWASSSFRQLIRPRPAPAR